MMTNILERLAEPILGRKLDGEGTRHRPKWWPKHFDKRWLGERVAVMDLPPYKPPHRRYMRVKAWVCMGPDYIVHRTVIAELDLDERTFDVEVSR